MSADQTTAEPPLPPRVAWFAPWTWTPWKRWLLFAAVSLGYPLSLGPTVWLHDRQRLPQWASPVVNTVYLPLGIVIFTGWDFGVLKRYVEFWESLP